MIAYKCKMCGGPLSINEDDTITECPYCGTIQTIPKLDSERKLNLFDRANHFRRNNDYDKAMSLYEKILEMDPEDAESYWSIVLCRFGIEYVEDPQTHKRIPTINRTQKLSILKDADYLQALKYASEEQKKIYIQEAKAIDVIQKGILEISNKEEPFDVFICYKESDEKGQRTIDSVIAQDIYKELTNEGLKVFFSRITLEDKLGVAYEPYIFAALNSAKVMIVVGTNPINFNAVWVRNEWARYLSLMAQGDNKTIIPVFKDMDPYDIPEELAHLQAQDMSKIGCMQDLVRGVKKITGNGKGKDDALIDLNISSILKRAKRLLQEKDYSNANSCAERVLDADWENYEAYMIKTLAFYHVNDLEELSNIHENLKENVDFQKAIKYADDRNREILKDLLEKVEHQYVEYKQQVNYDKAVELIHQNSFDEAEAVLNEILDYKDTKNLLEELTKMKIYFNAQIAIEKSSDVKTLKKAINNLGILGEYEDSQELLVKAKKKIKKHRLKRNLIIGGSSLAIIITTVILLFIYLLIPMMEIKQADKFVEEGLYIKAGDLYRKHGDFGDSAVKAKGLIVKSKYQLEQVINEEDLQELIKCGADLTINFICEGNEFGNEPVIRLTNDTYNNEEVYVHKATNDKLSSNDFPILKKDYAHFNKWVIAYFDLDYKENCKITIGLKAEWKRQSIRVYYDLGYDGKTDNEKIFIDEDNHIFTPERKGYDFLGWSEGVSAGIVKDYIVKKGTTESVFLKAHWVPHKYSYKLDYEGFGQTLEVEYNSVIKLPPVAPKKGYKFIGWTDGNVIIKLGDLWHFDKDLVLKPKFDYETFNITYENISAPNINVSSHNNSIYIEDVKNSYYDGDEIKFKDLNPLNPDKNSIFLGWYWDSYFMDLVTDGEIETNKAMYANWMKMDDTNYKLINLNESILKEAESSRKNIFVSFTNQTINIILNKPATATLDVSITFNSGYTQYISIKKGETKSSNINMQGQSYIVLPSIPYDYYVTSDIKNIQFDELIAHPNDNFGYLYNETDRYIQKAKYKSQFDLITPERKGYDFLYWMEDGAQYVKEDVYSKLGDTILVPKWKLTEYKISVLNQAGTLDKEVTIHYGDTLEISYYIINGYTFDGWYWKDRNIKNGMVWDICEDVTLTPKYTAIMRDVQYNDIVLNKATVTYHNSANYGREPTIKTYNVGDRIDYFWPAGAAIPAFLGWYKDPECTQPIKDTDLVIGDLDLYPKYGEPIDQSAISLYAGKDIDISSVYNYRYFVSYLEQDITLKFKGDVKGLCIKKSHDSIKETVVEKQDIADESFTINMEIGDIIFVYIDNSDGATLDFTGKRMEDVNIHIYSDGVHIATYSPGNIYKTKFHYMHEYKLIILPDKNGQSFDGWYYNDEKIPNEGIWRYEEEIVLTPRWV